MVSDGLQSPDFEVVVRVSASDAAIAAGFLTSTDEFDIVVGVTKPSEIGRVVELLELTIVALNAASWVSLDDLYLQDTLEGED